jgi:arginyl-tRNA synthetase
VIQNFLERLAKALHNFYNHQEVVPILINPNNKVFEICPNSGQNTVTIL